MVPHLKALIFTSVDVLLILSLLGGDERRILRPRWERHPCVIQNLQTDRSRLQASMMPGASVTRPRAPVPHLSAQRRPPCALGLLVAFRQSSITRPQPLAGSVVNLHGNALRRTLFGKSLRMARLTVTGLPVAQEVFKPSKQLWKFSENHKGRARYETTLNTTNLVMTLLLCLYNCSMTQGVNSPQERDDQLHQLSTGNDFLIEDVQTAKEVLVGLRAPQGLLNLSVCNSMASTPSP